MTGPQPNTNVKKKKKKINYVIRLSCSESQLMRALIQCENDNKRIDDFLINNGCQIKKL